MPLEQVRTGEDSVKYPMQVVCAWIGNSRPGSAKHYLQVTEDHFRKAAQDPVQHPAAAARRDPQAEGEGEAEPAICGPVRDGAACCNSLQHNHLPPRGLEPLSPG